MKLSNFLLPAIAFAGENDVDSDVTAAFKEKGWELFFKNNDNTQNSVISPYSIIGSLYMVAAGAGGTSRKEILASLDLNQYFTTDSILDPFTAYHQISQGLQANSTHWGRRKSDAAYELKITNGMFYQEGLREGLEGEQLDPGTYEIISNDFVKDLANVRELDFFRNSKSATNEINEWAEESTNGKIVKLFNDDLDSDTKVVLASALYLKAQWMNPFEVLTNKKLKKMGLDPIEWYNYETHAFEKRTDIEWLYQEANIRTWSTRSWSNGAIVNVYELPMSMKRGGQDAFNQLLTVQIWMADDPEEDISAEIAKNYNKIRTEQNRKKLKFFMPKVKLSFKEDIKEKLEGMGITEIFEEGNADFSPLLGDKSRAFVSKVNHAVEFEIDENGIEGAAVTASVLTSRSMSQPSVITINRPYYFVVTNRCWTNGNQKNHCPFENIPLFIGRVTDPAK